jgi:hypothetical protein
MLLMDSGLLLLWAVLAALAQTQTVGVFIEKMIIISALVKIHQMAAVVW